MTDWTSPQLRDRLADRFAEILKEWLTPDELAEVRRRNASDPAYHASSCASHDFTDANMAMAQAWGEMFDIEEIDADNEEQTALWNSAWEEANRRHLTAS